MEEDTGNRMIGVIDLSDKLNIDIVTDIFIRINSKLTKQENNVKQEI